MKIIDWNIVFNLMEFCEYHCTKDLIQLSMSSKKSRNLLAKDIFIALNLRSFICNKDYSSLFKDISRSYSEYDIFINPFKPLNRKFIESKKQFTNDLKLFNGNPKKLVINDYGSYHYLLNEIPSIFPNVTTLVLNGSEFTMDTFQYLLDNFKYLVSLELTDNLIFHNAEISTDYTITYPTSLKSLKLRGNGVIMVYDKINPISIQGNKRTTEMDTFFGTHQHLPNLTTFDCDSDLDLPNEDEDENENEYLSMFIRLNPQLKCLKLCEANFSYELFDIIKDYESLTHLKFNFSYCLNGIGNYEMPVFPNIKHLHLKDVDDNIDEISIDNFPNVTKLVIESIYGFHCDENSLIKCFKNLKSLKFISNDKPEYKDKLTLPKLNCLEKLEFNFDYEEECFEDVQWDVNACDKLKLITYTKNEIYPPFEMPKLTEELAKHWDFYYLSHKLTFIKIQ